MKKEYIVPVVEIVNVRLFGSVMQDELPMGRDSQVGLTMDAKKLDFEDFDTEEDIWAGRQMKDVWER